MLDYEGKTYDEPRGWMALGPGRSSASTRFRTAGSSWGRGRPMVGASPMPSGSRPRHRDGCELEQALEARFATAPAGNWVDRLREPGSAPTPVVALPD